METVREMGKAFCFDVRRVSQNDTSPIWYGTGSCLITFFVQPAVCLSGFILNTVCLYIFCWHVRRKNQRTRMVRYLTGLCLFDALLLLFSIFVLILPQVVYYLRNQSYISIFNWLRLNALSAYSVKFLMPLLLTCNYCSVWTITAISLERFRAICYPFKHSTDSPYLVVFGIFLVAFLINSIRFWEYTFVVVHYPLPENNVTATFVYITTTHLKEDPMYHLLLDKVLYAIMVFILPFIILTILNSRVLHTLTKSSKTRTTLTQRGTRKQVQLEKRQETRTALMICCIVVVFFLCNTGGLIMRLVEPGKWIKDRELEHQFFNDINNLLFNLNSLLNPTLYFLFTRNFRDLLHTAVGKRPTMHTTTTRYVPTSNNSAYTTLMVASDQSMSTRRSCPTATPKDKILKTCSIHKCSTTSDMGLDGQSLLHPRAKSDKCNRTMRHCVSAEFEVLKSTV